MAQSQPATVPVSCSDETSSEEPLERQQRQNPYSVAAGTTNEVETVSNVGTLSAAVKVEVSHNVHDVHARSDEKEGVPHVANYTSVIAGKYIML